MSREKILITTSWISTIGNAILSVSKIIIGLFAGSLAVVGDGIDSATDVVISIVMIFTARLINRPPSKKYVFGYEKAEGIATKILSLVIFYAGVQMLLSSTKNIFSDEVKEIPSLSPSMSLYFLLSVNSYWLHTSTNRERRSTVPCSRQTLSICVMMLSFQPVFC